MSTAANATTTPAWFMPACEYPAVGVNCNSTWIEEGGTALHVLEVCGTVLYGILLPFSVRRVHTCWQDYCASKKALRGGNKAALEASQLRFIAAVMLLIAGCAALALLRLDVIIGSSLETRRAKSAHLAMCISILSYYTAAGCLMLLFRSLIAVTANINTSKDVGAKKLLLLFVAPDTAVMITEQIMVELNAYGTDPILAFRIALAGCVVPITVLLIMVRHFGKPMITSIRKAADFQAASSGNKDNVSLRQLAVKLERMLQMQYINCGVCILIYAALPLSPILHTPGVAVGVQAFTWLVNLPFFHISTLYELKKQRSQRVKPVGASGGRRTTAKTSSTNTKATSSETRRDSGKP